MEITNQTNETATKKRNKTLTPEGQFMFDLGTCLKNNDLSGALSLYDHAVSHNLRLNHNHVNALLYLCSNSLTDSSSSKPLDSSKASVIEKGFHIFDRMIALKIRPTEATITAMARLAAAKGDGNLAFELVKNIRKYRISPKLRSYGPALFAFCNKLEADKAYSVEEHMISMNVNPEEPELTALLKVSAEAGREEKVYSYLQKLRSWVRCVSGSTAEALEGWFCSDLAAEAGALDWDQDRIRDATLNNGGGWHGQGWLGKGKWVICRSKISSEGCCNSCCERLACADIDREETEMFAESVASLAFEREYNSNFTEFQEWLDNHADYEVIVDGANVGLHQQNFVEGGFSVSQLDAVVKEFRERSQGKWPLVILHTKRYWSLMDDPSNKELLEEWETQEALYITPKGSNDDWYWIYAAVKLRCLLVTNDEMRDHIFELFGGNFFLQWKEQHQVRFTFHKCDLELQMPPLYSVVIQESEKGSWHVPIEDGCSDEASGTWLCISRSSPCQHSDEVPMKLVSSEIVQSQHSSQSSPTACETEIISKENGFHSTPENGIYSTPTSFQLFDGAPKPVTGKRKERSPSPSNCHHQPY